MDTPRRRTRRALAIAVPTTVGIALSTTAIYAAILQPDGIRLRATWADADQVALLAVPGVEHVEVRGDTVLVQAADSDAVARYAVTATPARDLEVTARGLEEAFIALTTDDRSGR